MIRKVTLAGLLFLAFLALAPRSQATPLPLALTLENFESYADDAVLQTAWTAQNGTPQQSLGNVPHGGEQSLQLDYNLTVDPFFETVALSFGSGINLTSFTTLTVWFQGLPTNGHDGVYLALLEAGDEEVLVAGSAFDDLWVDEPGWQRWDVDLSAATETPDAVTKLVLGVELLESGSTAIGTVYFDDISLSNGVETVWLGGSSAWASEANWDNGVPSATRNARIPGTPAGGTNFPLISAAGAAVHDLLIEPGASLDLGQQALDVSGTLTNRGKISQRESIGANAVVPFLTLGANPGLIIETESFLSFAPNAPAVLTEGLGETDVAIRGGRSCDASGTTVQRCYDINPANNSAAAKVTFFFAHEELNQQECAALSLFAYHDKQWQQSGTVTSRQCVTAPYSVTVEGVRSFSPFALAEETPVAIGLHDFGAARPAGQLWPMVILLLLPLGLFLWLRLRPRQG